jgi:hypothetical protein
MGQGQSNSRREGEGGDKDKAISLPFLATIFHTVGLKVMDPSERKREDLDASMRALRDMIATSSEVEDTEPLAH